MIFSKLVFLYSKSFKTDIMSLSGIFVTGQVSFYFGNESGTRRKNAFDKRRIEKNLFRRLQF